ncbi:hypothetical protein J7M28_02540 [bacterium]|nr:hypothetical protein [bacterium]
MDDSKIKQFLKMLRLDAAITYERARRVLGREFNPLANLPLKVFAALLAIFLWMLATMANKENIRMPSTLRFTGLSSELLILEQTTERLDVTVRGTAKAIDSLTADQINLTYDLSGITAPREFAVTILPENISTPPGTEVVSVMPSSVVVNIGRKSTVTVPVRVEVKGKPAPDFRIVDMSAEPKFVQLQGPESVLSNVKEVKAEPISVEGARQPFTSKAYLIPIHQLVSFVNNKSVIVRVDISEKVKIKMLYSIPIQQIPPERVVKMIPSKINVEIRGPVSVLRDVKQEEIVGIIDVMDLRPGTYLRTPRLSLPERTSVKSRDPDKVTIIIKNKDVGGAKND